MTFAHRFRVTRLFALIATLALGTAAPNAGATERAKKEASVTAKTAPVPTTSKTPDAAAAVAGASMSGAATEAHPSFSVDMVMTHDGQSYTMRRTVDHGKTRMDIQSDDMKAVQITLDDAAGTTYMLMPEDKRGIKQTRAGTEKMMGDVEKRTGKKLAADPESTPETPPGKLERIGQETLDGRLADKYRVQTAEGAGTMWIDAERQVPLKMEAEGSVVTFKNYQFGPQPAELFQPPKGYEIMDMDEMMARMPKGAMGGMGGLGVGGVMGGMAGGMARGYAGNVGGTMGATLGGTLGGALGGPIGSMIGQYVGQKIGSKIGTAAAGAVLPGK